MVHSCPDKGYYLGKCDQKLLCNLISVHLHLFPLPCSGPTISAHATNNNVYRSIMQELLTLSETQLELLVM